METLSVFRRARHSHLRVKKACSSNREALPRLLGRLLPRKGQQDSARGFNPGLVVQ
jgi:hypothetical protein